MMLLMIYLIKQKNLKTHNKIKQFNNSDIYIKVIFN